MPNERWGWMKTVRAYGLLALAVAAPAVGAPGTPAELDRDGMRKALQVSDTSGAVFCTEPEARAFDFWIGEWDVLNRNRRPDAIEFHVTGRATDRVHPVVGGCAIVEHWRGNAIGSYVLGFSIRSYDPGSGEWTIVLLWPTTGEPLFGELKGGFRHGRGEFSFQRVSDEGDPVLNRFTFSDIGPRSLRWENGTSRDGGRSWVGHWIMEFTRRPPTASALLNGPSMTTRRCPGEPHRRFDGALGEWEGTRTGPAGDSTKVRTHLVRILEGCAIVERTWSLDGDWESFRVRGWEPAAGRWVEYAIDSEARILVRREADPDASELILRDVRTSDARESRIRWSPGTDGAPGWVVEQAEHADGPWQNTVVFRFDRPLAAP